VTRWFYLSVALTLAALAASLALCFVPALYDRLPEQIPTHWGPSGEPDAWVPKADVWRAFLLVPGIMAGVVLLTLALPWLSPRKFDLDRFLGTFHYIMFLMNAMLAYIHFAALLGGLQAGVDTTKLVLAGICLFLALIGNVLGKVKRNFYVGVRTPWTLASETVWVATHRLAAWLFVAGGLLGFVLVLLLPVGLFYVAFLVILVAALVPVLYSLILYKRLEREGKLEPPAEANPQEVHAG
jgi:uncharacterized membrane protein